MAGFRMLALLPGRLNALVSEERKAGHLVGVEVELGVAMPSATPLCKVFMAWR